MKDNLLEKVPQEIKTHLKLIGKLAGNLGISVFAVGGFVRDILLKKENLDLDIVVEADAIDFSKQLARKFGCEAIIYKKFATATLFKKNLRIDIVTARKENYSQPGALPDILPGTIRDDLFRRDFTINAMAISLNASSFGELEDFFSGLKDLRQRKIRILHDLSFIDDPTRILRAIRFKERFGFTIEENTACLMNQAIKSRMLSRVSSARIFDELLHILKEDNPIQQILSVQRICGLGFISPKLHLNASRVKLLKKAEKEIQWFAKAFVDKRSLDLWLIYFIILLDGLAKPEINKLINRFNLKKGESKRIISYCNIGKIIKILENKNLSLARIFSILEPLSYEVILLIKIKSNLTIVEERIKTFFNLLNGIKLEVGGGDLENIGLVPGKKFGLLLKKALYKKVEGKLKTKKDELDFIRRLSRIK